jgi:hypothetical protein
LYIQYNRHVIGTSKKGTKCTVQDQKSRTSYCLVPILPCHLADRKNIFSHGGGGGRGDMAAVFYTTCIDPAPNYWSFFLHPLSSILSNEQLEYDPQCINPMNANILYMKWGSLCKLAKCFSTRADFHTFIFAIIAEL